MIYKLNDMENENTQKAKHRKSRKPLKEINKILLRQRIKKAEAIKIHKL